MNTEIVPRGFRAVILTLPPRLEATMVARFREHLDNVGVDISASLRFVNARHLVGFEESGVRELIAFLTEALDDKMEFALLDPSEPLRTHLDLHESQRIAGRLLTRDDSGMYPGRHVEFIPEMADEPPGRIDVYQGSFVTSYIPRGAGYDEYVREVKTARITKSQILARRAEAAGRTPPPPTEGGARADSSEE